jgi:hypothetical protein
MAGPIQDLLGADHVRLGALLDQARRGATIDLVPFNEFRAGLLRHIAMEEKVLLPFARELRGGEPLPAARQLKLDHAAIASLLVPTPTREIIAQLTAVLAAHNVIEEGDGGVYAECEKLAGARVGELVDKLKSVRPVAVASYQDVPRAFASIERLMRNAGRG